MGDGVLGYFGYPQAHEHDAERAVRAGLAIVEAAPTLQTAAGVPLQVRVGIATGIVIVGDLLGSGEAQEHEVVGGTPNLAARLQGIAEPDSVVTGRSIEEIAKNEDHVWNSKQTASGNAWYRKDSVASPDVNAKKTPPRKARSFSE